MPKRKRKIFKRGKQTKLIRSFIGIVAFLCGMYILALSFLGDDSPIEEPTGFSFHREEAFIEKMAEEATRLEEEYGILPSVTIAQAILESNWGQSGLAQNEQNYFGIKGSSEAPQYATREYEEDWVEVEASFRTYESWEESMEDYAKLLAYGTDWDSELYHEVIEADHYVEAAKALQEAGYATDPEYSDKVIALVEEHDLDRFDN